MTLFSGVSGIERNSQKTLINLFDYGARFYNPVIGRSTTQDRFAEKYLNLPTYQYGANNPILLVDFNGDRISVAEQYRVQFNSALESVFGKDTSKKNFARKVPSPKPG